MHSTRSVDSRHASAVSLFAGLRRSATRTSKNVLSHRSSPAADGDPAFAVVRAIRAGSPSGSSPDPCWIAVS